MTLKYITLLATGALILSAQQPTQPATPGVTPRDPAKQFQRLDKDKDGKLSLEEFKAIGKDPAKREKRFHKLDTNGDNFISMEEFAAAPAPHKK